MAFSTSCAGGVYAPGAMLGMASLHGRHPEGLNLRARMHHPVVLLVFCRGTQGGSCHTGVLSSPAQGGHMCWTLSLCFRLRMTAAFSAS